MLTSITVETLTQIWQRVLERNPIGSEENFFDLGGNDLLADLLFIEIAFAFGRQLPRAAIGCAPTIAALAALLEEPSLPAHSPFVQMKPGSEKPPIFIVHGLGGRTAEFYDLVRRIQTEHPIYGIQAKGIDGFEKPLERVEDMARFYLAALDEIEPRGPYLLIGYSFGGLVALEMAQQLSEIGRHVALLMLLDAYPDARSLAPAQRLRLIAQRVKFHLNEMRRLPLSEAKQCFVRKLAARRCRSTIPNETVQEAKSPALSLAQASLRVEKKAFLAMTSYRPRTYHGKMTFIAAAETKSFFLPPDPALIWRDFAEQFELDTVPGDHMEMVTNDALASVLARYTQDATS